MKLTNLRDNHPYPKGYSSDQNLNTPESTSEFSRLLAEWFSLPRWKNQEMVKPNSRFLVRRFVCVTWRTGAKETVSLEYLSS